LSSRSTLALMSATLISLAIAVSVRLTAWLKRRFGCQLWPG
jgi:hypothetical protein